MWKPSFRTFVSTKCEKEFKLNYSAWNYILGVSKPQSKCLRILWSLPFFLILIFLLCPYFCRIDNPHFYFYPLIYPLIEVKMWIVYFLANGKWKNLLPTSQRCKLSFLFLQSLRTEFKVISCHFTETSYFLLFQCLKKEPWESWGTSCGFAFLSSVLMSLPSNLRIKQRQPDCPAIFHFASTVRPVIPLNSHNRNTSDTKLAHGH